MNWLDRLAVWWLDRRIPTPTTGIELPAPYGSHWHDYRVGKHCKYCGKTPEEIARG